MKDSGIEWIGEIPKHWNINKIKYTSYVKGRIGWQGLRSEEFTTEGPYLITGTDFIDGKIKWSTCNHVESWRYNQDRYIQIKKNDVLITKDGTIGKVAIIDNIPDKTTLNTGVMVIRPLKNSYDPSYLFWILKSNQFIDFIDLIKQGSTIQHLYQKTFDNFPIVLPDSLEEQKQIVDYLDKKTKEIDNEISKNKKLITLLQKQIQSTINHAVTKGLDDTIPMKDSGVEIIGKIPESWSILKGKYFLKIYGGGELISPIDENDKANFFKVEDLNHTNADMTLEHSESHTSKSGKIIKGPIILIPKRGEAIHTNKVVITHHDCSFDSNIMGLGTKKFDLRYVAYFLLSRKLSDIADTTTIPQINNKHIKPLEFPNLPLQEQKQIADYLDKKSKKTDLLISKVELQIKQLLEFRQSLISSAVTGKIQVAEA